MKTKVEDEIDALFTLPLAEFTSVRNTLAARLKKEKLTDEAERVKLLGKPPVSAWAVNQLYWNHRDEFEQLIATGKRFHSAQASRSAAKVANMRDSLAARRQSLADLSELATELLRDAGHNPSQDTLRRIITTLEALSAYALLPDGPTPGRLTQDVDPPSFELLASLISGGVSAGAVESPARKSATKSKTPAADTRQIRQAKIAEAKVLLQEAKKSLFDARAKAQSSEAAQKKAIADAKETEKQKRTVEERLQRATAVAEAAALRARSANEEAAEAAQAVEEAKRAVEVATKELESLLQS